MNKERLYLSEEQDIDGIISECKKNKNINGGMEYFIDALLPPAIVVMTIIVIAIAMLVGTRHYLQFAEYVMFVVGIMMANSCVIGVASYFYQNRYYINRDYKTMNIKQRYELVQKICEAFNLSLMIDIEEKDVESKITILKKLYEDGRKYRNKVFKIMNRSLIYLLGLSLSTMLTMKGKIVLDIVSILILAIIAIITLAFLSCIGPAYEMCRYAVKNSLVPYGHLIDYSIYWLKFLKEELPEIKDYLKKSKSMQDIENYEKEVSIKKFAKVYIEWKNLSSNKEKQVINILKEESDHTIQMLNESKYFEKLSKELDEKLEKSNSLSEY